MEKARDKARRLARILADYTQDPHTLAALAHYLHYVPEDLQKDAAALAAVLDVRQ